MQVLMQKSLQAYGEIQAAINAAPTNWLRIEDLAARCAFFRNEVKSRRAERAILAPIGLTRDTFIRRQREMDPQLIKDLTRDLINYFVPSTSVIVTGSDPTGLHIYVVEDGQVHCLDTIGFAAIGTGARHAQSQLMHAGYSPTAELSDTLSLIHAAKRRAERAPHVGAGYDLFMVRPELGSYSPLRGPELLRTLDQSYARLVRLD